MYENKSMNLENQIKYLIENKEKVILFGSTVLARMAKRALNRIGIEVLYFCDNNKDKQGQIIDGVEVKSPDIIKNLSSDYNIIICAYREKAYLEIFEQIRTMGEYNCFRKELVEYLYQTRVLKRELNIEDFEKAINSNKENNPLYIEKAISINVTNRCTLNCKNCLSYLPYFQKKLDRDAENIIDSLKKLAVQMDYIQSVSLVGGEALLYKDIAYLCQEIAKISNIGMIRILTNGNTKPDKELFEKLSSFITEICISDYKDKSKYKEMIANVCLETGIICNIQDYAGDSWFDLGGFEKRGYSESQLEDIFKKCNFIDYCMPLKNGKLYFCGRSSLLEELAGQTEYDSDYFDLYQENQSGSLIQFITSTKYLNICNHCGLMEGKCVPAAEQTSVLLSLNEESM